MPTTKPSEKLMRYVPKKLRAHVTDAYHDSDGYWINFDDSVDTKYDPFMNCGTIHEDTIREVRERLAQCVILPEQK
jgi:hypothetical protein